MKLLQNTAILVGLAAYGLFFYITLLPSLSSRTETWRRGQLVYALAKATVVGSNDSLFVNWFGVPPQFSLGDRAGILLAAGLILVWAAVLGWLLLSLLRVARGLTRLETTVFSTAVGLNLLSTWTLAAGLFGQLGRLRAAGMPALLTLVAAAGFWYWRRRSNRDGRERTGLRTVGSVEDHLALAAIQSAAGLAVGPAVELPAQRQLPAQRRSSPSPQQRRQLQRHQVLLAAYRRCAGFVGRHWLCLALPFLAAILLAAMLPPTDFDVCEYHLQAPKEFYQRGQITFLPHNVYANMPLGAEMLSLLAMTVAGDWWWGGLVGKTVIAAFTPLCALGLFAAGRRFYSTGAGVVAALVYISIPWLTSTAIMPNVNVTCSGLIEGASACYLFLALYALLLSRGRGMAVQLPSQRDAQLPSQRNGESGGRYSVAALVALSGYLAGGAVATKYPAVLFVLIPLALWTLVGRSRQHGDNRDRWSAAGELPPPEASSPTPPRLRPEGRNVGPLAACAVFLLAAALGCGLWFAKNWVLTGNPTYPLMYGTFGGTTWNAEKERRWERAHLPHDFAIETLGKDLEGVVLTSEWISPLVVPLALLALLAWGNKPAVIWRRLRWELLAYAVFVIAAWWLFTHRIDRFWLPLSPVLALLAGAGACWSFEAWWRRVLKGLLLAALGANFLISAAGPLNAWFIPLDQLRNDTQWVTPCHYYVNNDADRGAVLTVGDAAVFDLKPVVFYNTCFDDCVFEQLVRGKALGHVPPQEQLRPANEIRREFASLRLAYVLVDWGEIKRYRDTYGFTDFVQPQVFERLVDDGILELVPQNAEPLKKIYRVKQ